jgi:hypothetical protein
MASSSSSRDDKALNKLSFNDPTFLSHFGLSATNILDYFYCSPFFDTGSNNQALRMQGASLENLKTMKGIQYMYVYSESEPKLFKVKKVMRESPTRVHYLETYYCLEGTFYQSPDLHELISTRNKKIQAYMKDSFENVAAGVTYTAAEGHVCFRNSEEAAEPPEHFDFRSFPPITALVQDIAAIAALPLFGAPVPTASADEATAEAGGKC